MFTAVSRGTTEVPRPTITSRSHCRADIRRRRNSPGYSSGWTQRERSACGNAPSGPLTAAMRWMTAGRGAATSPCSKATTVSIANASRSSPGRSRKSGLRGRPNLSLPRAESLVDAEPLRARAPARCPGTAAGAGNSSRRCPRIRHRAPRLRRSPGRSAVPRNPPRRAAAMPRRHGRRRARKIHGAATGAICRPDPAARSSTKPPGWISGRKRFTQTDGACGDSEVSVIVAILGWQLPMLRIPVYNYRLGGDVDDLVHVALCSRPRIRGLVS